MRTPRPHSTSVQSRTSKKRRRRTYNVRLIRRNLSYSINEIAELFALHPQAVRQWLKAGLQTIDDRKPILIHGTELIRFLTERQSARKQRCQPDQFFCCQCRVPKRPRAGLVSVQVLNERQLNLAGHCEDCGSPMNQLGSVRRLDQYQKTFIVESIAALRLGEDAHPPVICHLQELGDHAAIQPKE